MAESEEELKSLVMKVEEECEKVGLKCNIQKSMASSPITSWQTMETVTDLIFLSLKVIADGECHLEIKKYLLLGRNAMKNHSFDYTDFGGKVMYLLFNMLSRFVIAFLPWSKVAVVPICSDFGAKENKVCHCFHCFPIYLL